MNDILNSINSDHITQFHKYSSNCFNSAWSEDAGIKQIMDKYLDEKFKAKSNEEIGTIFKPVPSPIDKIKNNFRWRIILKGKINSKLLNLIQKSIDEAGVNQNVSLVVDLSPNNMM